jgi:DNA adenine methylase
MNSQNELIAKPFVKWVGGKGHLLSQIRQKYPKELGVSIDTYIEPFVGGGAVLFDILSNFRMQKVIINDINPRLVNTYIQIKTSVEDLIKGLKKIESTYYRLEGHEQSEFYYKQRELFNKNKDFDDFQNGMESAVLFIFLNKTCFNGLYRENKQGVFNVPIGRYKNPKICDEKNLIMVSKLLQNVTIVCGEYYHILENANEHSFVYFDPPYRPISPTEAFTMYHRASSFGDDDQRKMALLIQDTIAKGALVLVSNSDPKTNDDADNFFDNLYENQKIERIPVRRFVSGRNKNLVSELLISNTSKRFQENK